MPPDNRLGATPFGFKAHSHVEPVFVAACRDALERSHHREALAWVLPFCLAATDMIEANGSVVQRRTWVGRRTRFLDALGLLEDGERVARYARAEALHRTLFDLVDEMAHRHPAIVG